MTTIGSAGITFLNTTSQNTSGLINVQTFNASGTWTKPSGYSANSRVLIQAWGAGGSGGRNGTTIAYAGGGGGGGYNESWLLLSQLGATETVTVGAGGAARTTNIDGATGGTTSVGSLINAFGGAGGQSAVSAVGGGGGGQLSAGGSGQIYLPGLPYILYDISFRITNVTKSGEAVTGVVPARHGEGARNRASAGNQGSVELNGPIMGYVHGGGGGGTAGNAGANTVYGGGGGGGVTSGAAGGASSFGGAGGAAGATATGGAGTQPGGGGGGATVTSGAGGAGRVSITVFPNSN